LLQMTTNLLHNAIVHNLPEHGTVQLNAVIQPESVWLTVENTGVKLTRQLVSTLTEPFQRGTERVRGDHAGAGLGLAIVKSIIQAHDGTLTLTPRAAGGLCVTVQLPAAPPADWPLRAESTAATTARERHAAALRHPRPVTGVPARGISGQTGRMKMTWSSETPGQNGCAARDSNPEPAD
jgi:anti-sigma regulatory factor (Ser/Thr protein kinase)